MIVVQHADLLRLLPRPEKTVAISGCACKGPVCCCAPASGGEQHICRMKSPDKNNSESPRRFPAFVNCDSATHAVMFAKIDLVCPQSLSSLEINFPNPFEQIFELRTLHSSDYRPAIDPPPRYRSTLI
jgi:hypothetical protein